MLIFFPKTDSFDEIGFVSGNQDGDVIAGFYLELSADSGQFEGGVEVPLPGIDPSSSFGACVLSARRFAYPGK